MFLRALCWTHGSLQELDPGILVYLSGSTVNVGPAVLGFFVQSSFLLLLLKLSRCSAYCD